MMDQLIITYINCQFANHIKFEFILEVLKFIFQKASIVYGMMDECTNFIREN